MTIFIDAASITSITSVISSDIKASIDAGSFSTKTALTSAEVGPFTDLATVGSLTQIPTGEFDFVHPTGSWGVFDTDDGVIP